MGAIVAEPRALGDAPAARKLVVLALSEERPIRVVAETKERFIPLLIRLPRRNVIPTDETHDDNPAAGAQARLWAKAMRSDGTVPANGAGTAADPAIAAPATRTRTRAVALAGFAAGVLSGIAGTIAAVTWLAAPPEAVVPAPIAAPALQSAPAVAAVAPTPVAPSPRMIAKRAPIAAAIPAPSTHRSLTTEPATERAWLDAARTALARNDLENARSNLETAGARFPDGRLREEREALAIHVLFARGDRKLAELALDTFRTRHPGSLFTPAIEDVMRDMEAKR